MTKTILIVDDEQPIRNLLSRYLTKQYVPLIAENVSRAKGLLENQTIDLIITDLKMPGESGIDLIKHVKQYYRDIGIIVVTTLDDPEQADTVLDAGIFGYIVKPFTENFVLITVANALRRVQLENQSRQLTNQLEFRLQTILDNIPIGFLLLDVNGNVMETNGKMEEWFSECLRGLHIGTLDSYASGEFKGISILKQFEEGQNTGNRQDIEIHLGTALGDRDILFSFIPVNKGTGDENNTVVMVQDLTEKNLLEKELQHAHKLEAIGQLAAGIAHEINTPVQYVGDNIRFIADAFEDVDALLGEYDRLVGFLQKSNLAGKFIEKIDNLHKEYDIEYLREEIPTTVQQTLEGVARIVSIVKAMKEFSHPGTVEQVSVDVNAMLQSSITISRNEWKYVADLQTDFSENLPLLSCFPGELNQVIVNMIVNSAHAIKAKIDKGVYSMGRINLSTSTEDESVVIQLSDNGEGMSENVRNRLFEPFFTTKGIGKGTGQGLTITRGIIEDKHGGKISCESEEGVGTTFTITLPLAAPHFG